MSASDATLPPSVGVAYVLDTYTDRQRLYEQFQLFTADLDAWFDRVLTLGHLDTDPKTACWRVLDIGCGEGLLAHRIVQRYPHVQVVGIDSDAEAISTAEMTWLGQGDLHFVPHDVMQPFPPLFKPNASGTDFDVVIASLSLMYVRDPAEALAHIAAALRPGGVIFVRDSPAEPLDFPHPSMVALTSALSDVIRRVAHANFGRQHAEYLHRAGFTAIESVTQAYVVGGPTSAGQRMFSNMVGGVRAGRRAVVEIFKMLDGATYDAHLHKVVTEATTAMAGHWDIVNTIGRKPSIAGGQNADDER